MLQLKLFFTLPLLQFSFADSSATPVDSLNCIEPAISADCACAFTHTKDLGHFLDHMHDTCVMGIVDFLIARSASAECRKSLCRIIAVSDGYLSEYFSDALSRAFKDNPQWFLQHLYSGIKSEKNKIRSLLAAGLVYDYKDNPAFFSQLKNQKFDRRQLRLLKKLEEDVITFTRLNPDY